MGKGGQGRSGRAGGQGRCLGAHAGAGPAGQGRDKRASPGCRVAAGPPPVADTAAAESRKKQLSTEVSRRQAGFVLRAAALTDTWRRGRGRRVPCPRGFAEGAWGWSPAGATPAGPSPSPTAGSRRGAGLGYPGSPVRAEGGWKRGCGPAFSAWWAHLAPDPETGGRRRASTFDTGAGSVTRVERGPLGPCGGQRHQGRGRQRARAPSCARGGGGEHGGTWWRGLFLP